MLCMLLTYYWLKFIYKPLFKTCAVIRIQTSTIDVFLQKYPAPVPCIDVTCVGGCLVLLLCSYVLTSACGLRFIAELCRRVHVYG